jgi:hypothetical protein
MHGSALNYLSHLISLKSNVRWFPPTEQVYETCTTGEMAASTLGESLLQAAQELLEAVLEQADAAALCQLKAVSAAWCTHARRELCNRLCRREGNDITELDVKCLHDAGRSWEVVVAGRELPHLARLRGFGFVVAVQAVRQAGLGGAALGGAALGGAALGGAALRSCIQCEGEPPHELLLAAVACAASGTVRGVPVQRLREDDAIGSLHLESASIGTIGAALLGLMLPAATSVRSLRCPSDNALRQRSQPAFLSAPADTPALSPSPHVLAVSRGTNSALTVARQLLPCSRTRRSLP